MLFMIGALLGEMIAGFAGEVMPERTVLMIAMIISAAAAILIIGGSKEDVSKIYNRIN